MRWRLLLFVRIRAVRLGFAIGRRRPLRHRILLATWHDPELRGNLAALRDHLAREHPDVAVEVFLRPGGTGGRAIARYLSVLFAAVRAGYLLARMRVVVLDDYFFPLYVIAPRPGTTTVQTWHACGAFKRFGYSVVDKSFGADAELLRHIRIHSNYDACLVSSVHIAPHYAEAFDQPLERFRSDLGVPRTDALFGDERIARVVADVRHRYSLPPDRRIVLYAPTFRGDSIGKARADGLPDWRVLRDRLAEDHTLLVRLHPFIRDALVIDRELDGFLTDVSDHADINDLLHVSDLLVTDYSSVIFEYALLDRPMVLFAPDLDEYEGERGFYFDYRTGVPGPVTHTAEALAEAIRDPTPDLERVRAFARRSFDIADGQATRRVVERLLLPALGVDQPHW